MARLRPPPRGGGPHRALRHPLQLASLFFAILFGLAAPVLANRYGPERKCLRLRHAFRPSPRRECCGHLPRAGHGFRACWGRRLCDHATKSLPRSGCHPLTTRRQPRKTPFFLVAPRQLIRCPARQPVPARWHWPPSARRLQLRRGPLPSAAHQPPELGHVRRQRQRRLFAAGDGRRLHQRHVHGYGGADGRGSGLCDLGHFTHEPRRPHSPPDPGDIQHWRRFRGRDTRAAHAAWALDGSDAPGHIHPRSLGHHVRFLPRRLVLNPPSMAECLASGSCCHGRCLGGWVGGGS